MTEVLLLGRHREHEHVAAALAAAHRADALTADAVALKARKLAEGETFTEPAKPTRSRSVQSQEETGGTVTFLSDWNLSHLPPDTRPLPSVAHYDQLRQRHGRTAGEKEGSRHARSRHPPSPADPTIPEVAPSMNAACASSTSSHTRRLFRPGVTAFGERVVQGTMWNVSSVVVSSTVCPCT
ncbi:hypothetical protein ABZ865_41385 [Streptomyces sp. NPDC047085]|uniref:hypothetical protein n=1 Tax=Streptomyces sp. NPDC047085 TaxID=3155140 RepID=UPI0033D9E497